VTVTGTEVGTRRVRGVLLAPVSAQAWLATIHLLVNLPVAVLIFVPVLTGVVLGLSLLPAFLVGVPILLFTLWLVEQIARFERARFAVTLGERIADSRQPRQPGESWGRRQRRRATSDATWRAVGYELLLMPIGTVTFALAVALWALPISLLTLPTYNWALPNGGADLGIFTVRSPLATVLVGLAGLVLLWAAPYVMRGMAAAHAAAARAMLGPLTAKEMAVRVGQLEHSRARVVDAAEAERRRIERDLHDGAQQRLVALAMNLGRARSRYDEDPAAARALLDEAHGEAKQALVELRDLARGIHPAVLTDRGLDAALSGLAGRCPVPVTVEVDAGARPSRTVEAIAYFVVAEALTNIAKHSRASQASVVVRRLNGSLRLVVTDDGVGGADLATGSGLAGLADRVSGVDGRLSLDSPAGGPTVLTVELPCES
jgi:signal transduction histidine kinase